MLTGPPVLVSISPTDFFTVSGDKRDFFYRIFVFPWPVPLAPGPMADGHLADGHFTDGHLAERIFGRQTFGRMDIWPKGLDIMAEKLKRNKK